MLHGKEKALSAEQTARKTFEENSLGENLPSVKISLNDSNKKVTIIDLLLLSKIESSKSEIRRLLKGNAIRINNKVIVDDKFLIENNLFDKNKSFKLSIGKKKHLKVLLS